MRVVGLAVLCLTGGWPGRLSGQQDTVRLTLDVVLTRVRGEHPLARAGGASIAAAKARAVDLTRYPNPSFEVERTTFSAADNVALMQPIRWPWEGSALRDLGRADVAAVEAEARGELGGVLLAAAQSFAEGLRDAGAVTLAVEAESLASRALAHTVAGRRLGQVGDLSVLQAQVGLDAARRARVAAQGERDAASASLAVLLGYDPGTLLAYDGELATTAPLAAPESAQARAAAAADPEAARLAAAAERGSQLARLAHARQWPQLELGPAASLEGPAVVGLNLRLTLPLWNWQGAAIQAGQAEREAALARLEGRGRAVAAQVLDATAVLSRAERELVVLRGGELTRAAQAESLAAQALEQGGPYLPTWLAARAAYLDARRAELDLEWAAAQARLQLRYLAGGLSPEAEQ